MGIEVLVTTMHQTNIRKYKEMNLQTDAVLANQSDCFGYHEEIIGSATVKMISTVTRGLSRNRNIAMAMSTGDFILFTDDDVRFYNGYAELIEKEFQAHPQAEAIRFDMNTIAISELKDVEMKKIEKEFRPATRRELAQYGVCGLVIRRNVLQKYNMKFNELFGTGTDNYCGEDTIFLQEMLNKGIKFYLSPVCIADIDKSESTWFEGYDEKFFTVAGKVFKKIYPGLAYLLAVRSAYKFHRRQCSDLSFLEILKCYIRGIRSNE